MEFEWTVGIYVKNVDREDDIFSVEMDAQKCRKTSFFIGNKFCPYALKEP